MNPVPISELELGLLPIEDQTFAANPNPELAQVVMSMDDCCGSRTFSRTC